MTRNTEAGPLEIGDTVMCWIRGHRFYWDVFDVQTESATFDGERQVVLASRKGQGSVRFKWLTRWCTDVGGVQYAGAAHSEGRLSFHLYKRRARM